MSDGIRRVQFVISGWSLGFLVLSIGLMTSGYELYTRQPRPQVPLYYVNRSATVIRPCFQCVAGDGKLKNPKEWKLGKVLDVPPDKYWWFSAMEDNPVPSRIEGIPMLPVHPATDNDRPWVGFDQRKLYFAVFQDLEPKFSIEHPVPASRPPAPVPSESTPSTTEQPGGPSPPAAPAQ